MRGRIAFLFTVALLSLSIVAVAQSRLQETASAGSDVILQGDADCNNVVNNLDAAAVLLQTAGGASVGCAARANVDCTGGVGVFDALLIVKYGAGLGAGGAGDCVAIGGELPDLDGEGMIDADLESGVIGDISTAVLYKAYWAFGDPALPGKYNVPSLGGDVPDEVFEPPAGVSAQTLAALQKYRLPPSNPDSWYYSSSSQGAGAALPAGERPPPNPNWTSVASGSGKIKVWYDSTVAGDQAKAQAVAADADNVFQKHKDIMDTEPLPDGGIDAAINGGGAQYDIYMTSIASGDYGYVAPFNAPAGATNPCPATVTFMVLNKDKSDNDIKGTLAHELFHAFQRARPLATNCDDRRFVFESTATWAEDYVYPNLQTERVFAGFKQVAGKAFLDVENRYHAWPFWLYIARSDSPDTIGEIFKRLETVPPITAMDEAILGGFESRWKEFTIYSWNTPTVDHFKQWDGLDWRPQYRGLSIGAPSSELKLADDQTVREYNAEGTPLQAMSFEYYRLTIPPPVDGFKDPPMLTINNPFGSGAPAGLAVQIAYRVGGTWETDDLTDTGSKTWCRTDPADKVEEVIVIVSNSNLPPAGNSTEFSKPVAVLRDACGFTGEAHGTYIFNTSGTEWRAEVDATELVFVAFPGSLTTFKTVSGTVTQTYSGVVYNDTDETPGPCILSGSTTAPVLEDDGFLTITAQDANSVTYNLSGFTPETNVNATVSCPGDAPSNISLSSQFWVQVSGRISNNKNVLEGTAPGASEGSEYNWRLERSQNP